MIAGNVDEVVPPASARALWEAAGRPPILWYDCGHYSAVGFLLPGRPADRRFLRRRVAGPGQADWPVRAPTSGSRCENEAFGVSSGVSITGMRATR